MDTGAVLPSVEQTGFEDECLVASGAEFNILYRYTFLPSSAQVWRFLIKHTYKQ